MVFLKKSDNTLGDGSFATFFTDKPMNLVITSMEMIPASIGGGKTVLNHELRKEWIYENSILRDRYIGSGRGSDSV